MKAICKKICKRVGTTSLAALILSGIGMSYSHAHATIKAYSTATSNLNEEIYEEKYIDLYHADRDLSSVDVGTKQNPLGDVIADAVHALGKADAGFVQAGEFSDTSVTLSRMGFGLSDIMKALEYKGNTIGIVKMTGEQLRGAMENSLYQTPARSSAFLQSSGLVTSFNPSAPAGKRVTSIKVNGAVLNATKVYRVAMPMTLANGALGYFKYWKKTDIEKDTGISLETALTNYLNEHKTIAKGEDRLVASSK